MVAGSFPGFGRSRRRGPTVRACSPAASLLRAAARLWPVGQEDGGIVTSFDSPRIASRTIANCGARDGVGAVLSRVTIRRSASCNSKSAPRSRRARLVSGSGAGRSCMATNVAPPVTDANIPVDTGALRQHLSRRAAQAAAARAYRARRRGQPVGVRDPRCVAPPSERLSPYGVLAAGPSTGTSSGNDGTGLGGP
jgi:hypothetical protein